MAHDRDRYYYALITLVLSKLLPKRLLREAIDA
jgi:hypothetical protein